MGMGADRKAEMGAQTGGLEVQLQVEMVAQQEVQEVLKEFVVMPTTLLQRLLAGGHSRSLQYPILDRIFHLHQNHPWPLQRRRPKGRLLQ